MNTYQQTFTLKNADVNMYRCLRTSRLFEMLQEASIAHTQQLGAGREKTLDKGFLWVVTLQRCEIYRMPEYDETITLETWPGKTMHVLFPRYALIKDKYSNVIIRSSALWTLIDKETRHFIFPEDHDIHIDGKADENIPLPNALPSLTEGTHVSFDVPFSYVDLNGHMNNTRYFDLTDDISNKQNKKCIEAEYKTELHWKDHVDIIHQSNDQQHLFTGMHSDTQAFKIRIQY